MHDEHREIETGYRQRRLMPGRYLDLIVAGLGLVAFVVLMLLLTRWLFPVGVSLQDDSQGSASDARTNRPGQELSYAGQRSAANQTVAQLVDIRRNVQVKAYDSLAWSAAQQGIDLADQDSLQTLSRSGATVKLDDHSLLKVGPNSLIVFQAGTTDLFSPGRTNSLVMMEGTLGGYFASNQGSPLHLEVALPNGVARFVPGDSDAAVAFNINVNPDLSSSVSVHSGQGVVTVGGRTLSIEERQGVTISINGEILAQGELPGLPLAMQPGTGTAYRYRDIPPPLVFSWKPVDQVNQYRLKVARDEDMSEVVIDERFPSPQFSYEGLQDGVYYWQVSALKGYIEGPAAGPNQIRLLRDSQPPSLELLTSEYLDGQVVIRGRTDPGARVYIQGVALTAITGQFEKTIDIEPGTSLIVVEAVDDAGNVAYQSQLINSKFSFNGGAR